MQHYDKKLLISKGREGFVRQNIKNGQIAICQKVFFIQRAEGIE